MAGWKGPIFTNYDELKVPQLALDQFASSVMAYAFFLIDASFPEARKSLALRIHR
jgi:hypothetical protein